MPVTGRLPCQPDGIKFTQCVSDQKLVFSPLQENYALDRKVTHTLLRRSLSAFKIWGDRTARASCRSENCCFFFTLGLPARGEIGQTSIAWRLMGRFWWGLQSLFQNKSLFQMHYKVLNSVCRWSHNFSRNFGQKLRKVQKSAEKVARTTSYR